MTNFVFHGKEYHTDRIIGHVNPTSPESIIVFVGGMHGNEPTGVIAIQTVFKYLEEKSIPVNGRALGLCGNLGAIELGKRFLCTDLNRLWLHEKLDQLKTRSAGSDDEISCPENREQRELYELLQPILDETTASVIVIDLHTTSAPSIPFVVLNDQIANRNFGLQFPVPTVIGIEEYLTGPLLSYVNEFGHIALAYESGKHDDWSSCENHISFIYLALLHAGVVAAEHIPDLEKHQLRLENQCKLNRGIFEIIYREQISSDQQFSMNPGYQNFSPLIKDETLAHDRNGELSTPYRGQIFMPLYQSTGTEGFFVVRPVPKWALGLSTFLRKRNFEWFLTWLPGIHRSPDQPDTLIVDKRVARFLAKELFHLLGYRRKKEMGTKMIFSRREIVEHVNPTPG